MLQRLNLAGSPMSPEAVLAQLRRIQHHRIAINTLTPVSGVSTIHQDEADLLVGLKAAKPVQDAQMSLL